MEKGKEKFYTEAIKLCNELQITIKASNADDNLKSVLNVMVLKLIQIQLKQ